MVVQTPNGTKTFQKLQVNFNPITISLDFPWLKVVKVENSIIKCDVDEKSHFCLGFGHIVKK